MILIFLFCQFFNFNFLTLNRGYIIERTKSPRQPVIMQYCIKYNINIYLYIYLFIYLYYLIDNPIKSRPPKLRQNQLQLYLRTISNNTTKSMHIFEDFETNMIKKIKIQIFVKITNIVICNLNLNHTGIKMDRTLHYFDICLTNQQQYYNRFQAYNIIMNSISKIQPVLLFEILSQLEGINKTAKSQQNKYYLDSKSMYNMQIDFIFGLVQKATKMSQIQQLCNMQIDFSTNKTLKSQQNKSYLRSKCINQTCKNQQNKSYLN
eukprot:TRINITY_DN2677_c0_g1_i5.p1 TRINITY_DN2677_c0_g1~~TRINITY_DN2677_c0_g1_i5.p1  ORF type:complete len:263 (-),score=-29.51 TRINITY_DN2677_c0_g1_i5:148-936(-)